MKDRREEEKNEEIKTRGKKEKRKRRGPRGAKI